MKAVLAIVLVGVLVQGCVAAPAPEPQLINLFGSIVTTWANVTETLFTGTLTALNSLSDAIIQPLPVVGPALNDVTSAVNTLLINGIVSTVNVKETVAVQVSNSVIAVLNRLNTLINSIYSGQSTLLRNLANTILNRLTTAINRISNVLAGQGSLFSRIITSISTILNNILSIFLPQLNTCISKLNSLGLTTTVTRMDSYRTNTTAIVNNLNTNLAAQLTTYSSYVNTTVLQGTVNASSISASLLARISTVYNTAPVVDEELYVCLNSSAELTGYLQGLINENMILCLNASNAEVAAATANIGTNSAALQTSATNAIKAVCDCVETVTPASTMLQKAQAKTCADTASAKLTSDTVQTQANTISTNLQTALATAKTNFDTCVANFNVEIPPTVTYVESVIDACDD